MDADEFSKWARELPNAPIDKDDDSPVGDLAWRAMNAIVRDIEDGYVSDEEAIANEYANAICWAAFWLAAAAVVVTAIVRWA